MKGIAEKLNILAVSLFREKVLKEILSPVLFLKLGINWRNIEDTIKEVLFTEILYSLRKECQDLRLFTFTFKNMFKN